MSTISRLFICLLALLVLSGCYNKPVRHLASDAALIKAGVSTRDDVYTMLGDPDVQRMVSETVEEWVYYEEEANSSHRTPVVGTRIEVPVIKGIFESKGYGMITVTLENDLVSSVRYNSFEEGDDDWKGDHPWQENDK